MTGLRRHWIVVASGDHVARGTAQGFMQACHGKAAPLRRIAPGDQVIAYSPVVQFGGKDRLQAFTALGCVTEGPPYQVEMAPGFTPWRRDVHWQGIREVPIRPLLGQLAFTGSGPNWGHRFRYGLFEIGEADATLISVAMLAEMTEGRWQ